MKSFSLLIFFSVQAVLLRAFAPTANQRQMSRYVSIPATASAVPSSPSQLMMSAGGVVITGAAGGVGFAYAGEFMDRGVSVEKRNRFVL